MSINLSSPQMPSLHLLDMSIIALYLLMCLVIGLYKLPKIKNMREYALGNGPTPLPLLVGTILATHIGAGATVGTIEKIYEIGLLYAILTLLSPISWITTCYVFSRRIQYFREQGCITISDILEHLYGPTARWVANILAKITGLVVVSMQILAIGYLLSYYFKISQVEGALIGFGVLVLYSALGGIKAIIATDLFQAIILYIAIPAACFAAYYDIGGYNNLIDSLPPKFLSFELSFDNTILFSSLLFWSVFPFTNPSFVQRFLMAENNEQIKKMAKILVLLNLPLVMVIILIAYIVKVKVPDINPNMAFYYLIDHYLPIGVKGLVITGILAAIMSTADSWINTASIVWAKDIIKTLYPSLTDLKEVLIARFSVIFIASLSAILIFLRPNSVKAMDWLACSLWEPIIFVPLVCGLFNYKFSSKAFIASVVCAVICNSLATHFIVQNTDEAIVFTTCIGLFGSFLGMVGAKYYKNFGFSNKNIASKSYSLRAKD